MNPLLQRVKMLAIAGVGLALVACFFVVTFSILLVGAALFIGLFCVAFCVQLFKQFFRKKQSTPAVHVDENGHLIIEHDIQS